MLVIFLANVGGRSLKIWCEGLGEYLVDMEWGGERLGWGLVKQLLPGHGGDRGRKPSRGRECGE